MVRVLFETSAEGLECKPIYMGKWSDLGFGIW